MRIGDLKPQGSDRTIAEWRDMCDKHKGNCDECEQPYDCLRLFGGENPFHVSEDVEVEIPDEYFEILHDAGWRNEQA